MVNPRYRVYACARNQFESLRGVDYSQSEHEILQGQVALLYIQDTEGQGNFQATFDVTAQQIHDFRIETNKKVKFFGSMGGQDFPLKAPRPRQEPILEDNFVANAVRSLVDIITDYKLDGIDVSYETITVGDAEFVRVMKKLIRELKGQIPDLEVSITVPPALNGTYYEPLYVGLLNFIDYVSYQADLVADPVPTVKQLVEMYRVLPYPAGKLFAGYSINAGHWAHVPVAVFCEASRVLLNEGLISGTSDWIAIQDRRA